jgi:DNA-binding CsgD family transcriptional regulator/tetratricopeptide (TPR) repeat protein
MTAVRTATTLVGRDKELRQLEGAVRDARAARGTVLVIEGEAGIGKTRLLTEATARFTGPGDIVVRGQAVELSGGDLPYGVVADMLRDLRRLHTGVGRTLEPTVRASLGDLLTTLTGGEAPRLDRGLLLDSLVTLVETLGHGRLLWWMVEDLHWSDTSSRDVLRYLIRALGPAQVLVTMTVRTGEAWSGSLSQFVAETVRFPRVSRMELGPLTAPEVVVQVRQLAGGPVGPAVVDRVRRLGEGIPFWTEELVLGGIEGRGPVPDSVRGLIETRLLRLDETARRVVEAVSVVDRADHAMLTRVCGLTEDEVEQACATAVHHHVLVVSEDRSGYRFRHALLREAVADGLLPGRRRRLHRAWADELDNAASVDDSSAFRIEAAHHWARAGDPTRALTASYSAARVAEQASGQFEEAQLLSRVLQLWGQVDRAESMLSVTRSAVVVRCIATLFGSGQYDRCLELLDAELEQPENPVAALYLRLRRHVVLEDLARADSDDSAVEELADGVGDLLSAPLADPWTAPALLMSAYYLSDDDAVTAVQLSERAVEAARSNRDLKTELHAVDTLSWSLANLGRFDEAVSVLETGVQAAGADEPALASMLRGSLSWYLWAQGRYSDALVQARAALRYIRRPQIAPERVAWLAESLAEALISMGEWDEAARVLAEAVELTPTGQAAVTIHCLTGLLAVRRGDVAQARSHLASAARYTPPQEDALLSQRLPPRWLAAELAAADHDLPQVRAELMSLWDEPHPEVVSESLWRPMLLLARLEADHGALGRTRGDGDETSMQTWTQLEHVADRLHALGPVGSAWRAQLAAEHARAEGLQDVEAWTDVATQWAQLGQRHEQGYATIREVEALARSGDRPGAAQRLAAARDLADGLGSQTLVVEAEAVARRNRLGARKAFPRQRPGSVKFGSLTPRELEVLELVARGLDNHDVAARLVISSKTASVHVSNILAKLGVSSRTQATSLALREGLVPHDDN